MKRTKNKNLDKTTSKSNKNGCIIKSQFGSNPNLKSFDERDRAAFHEV